eukprot:TRINITY_DN5543_c0_g3_i2.p2 TRINITY_DN5543_c0_g3~~TRINITY_DN5543_c0_g3_i2.p2  ORF type:complete len:215 (-),score=-17.18 TRINITY_DN5543_c0_g3_i2:645-1289(-)
MFNMYEVIFSMLKYISRILCTLNVYHVRFHMRQLSNILQRYCLFINQLKLNKSVKQMLISTLHVEVHEPHVVIQFESILALFLVVCLYFFVHICSLIVYQKQCQRRKQKQLWFYYNESFCNFGTYNNVCFLSTILLICINVFMKESSIQGNKFDLKLQIDRCSFWFSNISYPQVECENNWYLFISIVDLFNPLCNVIISFVFYFYFYLVFNRRY